MTWTAPDPQGSPITSYTVTPFVGSTPQVPVTVSGSPPATSALMAGLTDGTTYTFQVTATNAVGTSASSAPSAAVTPADVPAPPAAVTAVTAGSGSLSVSWTPQSNGGSPITSYTVTPVRRVDGRDSGDGHRLAAGDLDHRHRADERHDVHVRGDGHQRRGHERASAASNPATPVAAPETCPCTIFGSQTPGTADSGDGSSVNVGTAFTTDTSGYITGHALLQGHRQHGHPRGQPVERQRHAAGPGHLHRRDGLGLAAGDLLDPGGGDGRHHLRRVVLRPQRPLRARRSTASPHRPTGPPLYALASANAPNGNGVYTYASTTTFPVNTYQATNYWVDPVYSQTLPSVPAAPTGVTATAGNGSATVSWTAPPGTVTSYTVTPFVGSTAGTPVTVTGSPPATSTTLSGLTNGTTYTFTVTATNSLGTGPASAPSNAVTPGPVPAAPTAVTAATAGPGSVTVSWSAPA